MATKKKRPADRMTAKELSTRDALQRINHEARLVNGLQQALSSAEADMRLNLRHVPADIVSDIRNAITELEEYLFWANCLLRNKAAKCVHDMKFEQA